MALGRSSRQSAKAQKGVDLLKASPAQKPLHPFLNQVLAVNQGSRSLNFGG
jgi:hypothetical protein